MHGDNGPAVPGLLLERHPESHVDAAMLRARPRVRITPAVGVVSALRSGASGRHRCPGRSIGTGLDAGCRIGAIGCPLLFGRSHRIPRGNALVHALLEGNSCGKRPDRHDRSIGESGCHVTGGDDGDDRWAHDPPRDGM